MPSASVTLPIYLSFDQYADLLTRCDHGEILQAFAVLDNPDLPRIPIQNIRLCTNEVIVLNFQSMWATEDLRIINVKNQRYFQLESQSAGRYCSVNGDCEILTKEECEKNPDCQQFRLAILSDEKGNELSRITIESDKSLRFTDDDLLLTDREGDRGYIYLHLDSESLVARHGDFGGLETP